ncbi:MAG: flagellar basal body L-ring protein FlgH [Nitrospirae bacterium]|nr:flagellar basal body L-ring protein FlgH [Nitrospirota bacterium]
MKIQSGWNSKRQESGVGSREPGAGNRDSGKIQFYFLFCILSSVFCILFYACASPSAKLPLPPPKYVYHEKEEKTSSANSLWLDSENIFEDTKARRLNDLVTIRIVENLSGSGKADTDTSRDSIAEYDMSDIFGMNTDFNLHNAFLLKDLYKGSNIFEPKVAGTGKSEFKGKGDTNREGKLVATITAKVVEVMPNGNLVIEARKEMTINDEKQVLVLAGMVRPDDIDAGNTVLSSSIADAQIYYVGDGVIQDKQRPGWLVRILDNVWPF